MYVVTGAGDVLCLDAKGQSDGNAGPFTDEARYMAGSDKPPVAASGVLHIASNRYLWASQVTP